MRLLLVGVLLLVACGGPVSIPDAGTSPDSGAGGGSGGGNGGGAGGGSGGGAGGGSGGGGGGAQPSSPVRINEIYVDRDLSGDRVEYVELIGPAGHPLAHLHLRLLGPNSNVIEDVPVTATDAGVIDSTGLWVIGGALAACNVDQQYGLNDWGMDNSSGAVELVLRSGATEVIDVVGYGALSTAEGPPVALPSGAGNSVGRRVGAADTNSTTADFCAQNDSCGAANNACM